MPGQLSLNRAIAKGGGPALWGHGDANGNITHALLGPGLDGVTYTIGLEVGSWKGGTEVRGVVDQSTIEKVPLVLLHLVLS